MGINIGPMTLEDLRLSLEWARIEGWNPGIDDAEAFFAADPDGFLMGRIDGEPAVSISAVAYGQSYGFIGLYICRPDFRGHGYGMMLARTALSRLAGRTVGLDGVVDRVENCAGLGFVFAHRSRRFGGLVAIDGPPDRRMVTVDEPMVSEIERLDRGFFPGPRSAFLHTWLVGAQSREAVALVDDGEVMGYGVIRDCYDGYKIGPLFAASAADADILFRALCSRRPGGTVFIDVPEPNEEGIALAKRYGMTAQFETARMYSGNPPALPLERIFGITSFELG